MTFHFSRTISEAESMTFPISGVVHSGVRELPAESTSFVGRRQELHEAKDLLSRSRLLTLTGVGGVGKTRLALCLAAQVRRAFADGVWVVDLSGVDDGRSLATAVADAVGLTDQQAGGGMAAVAARVAGMRSLLVLDNCEHLVDACAAFANAVLSTVSELRILATSREPLAVAGERVLTVPSLSVPPSDEDLPLDALLTYEAINLFADRAASAAEFEVNDSNRAAVATLCQQLDGVPLEIELAALRLRTLSVQDIVERLHGRLGLLATNSTTATPRHRSVRASVDWSFNLCSQHEQALWARLSVFPGDFDLDAAEEVCAGGALRREGVLDLVHCLVEKSILVRRDHGSHARYRLPATGRRYGQELLFASPEETDDETVLLRRHRDWYLSLARQSDTEWFSSRQPEWFARLEREHANLRSAMEFSFSRQDEASSGLEIAVALSNYWIAAGRLSEGQYYLDRALLLVREPSAARARVLRTATMLALLRGDLAAALPLVQIYRAAAEDLGDTSEIAYLAQCSGLASIYCIDLEQAGAQLEEALSAHRASGDPGGTLTTLILLALVASLEGDGERAVALAEECLASSNECGESLYHSYALWALGYEMRRRGDLRGAANLAQQSLRLRRHFNDWLGVGLCADLLAQAAAGEGDSGRAAQLLGVCQTAMSEVPVNATSACQLVFVNWRQCRAHVRRALGGDAFGRASLRGAHLSIDQAIELGLNEPEPDKKPAATTEPATSDQQAVLTRRERQVAELISQGMSNKQIAATLVVAQRTAEAHVEHILAKLDFRSRAQIASWIAGCSSLASLGGATLNTEPTKNEIDIFLKFAGLAMVWLRSPFGRHTSS